MKNKIAKLLQQEKGNELLGGPGKAPEIRAEFLERVLASKNPESALPEAISVLKLTTVGAAAALITALWISAVETETRQKEAAMVWSNHETTE